jgi:hypothetical protein
MKHRGVVTTIKIYCRLYLRGKRKIRFLQRAVIPVVVSNLSLNATIIRIDIVYSHDKCQKNSAKECKEL